jgi:TolA-binding protein
MIKIAIAGGLLAAAMSAGWYGIAAPRIELAELARDSATALADVRAEQLRTQQQQRDQLTQLDVQMAQLRQTITRNDAAQQRLLQELRRNDQETRDWLAGTGPAALGRLYARQETTDPGAYRSAPGLPADPMQASGAPPRDRP